MDFPNVSFSKEERGMRTISGQVLQIPPAAAKRSASGLRFMRTSVYSNHNLATVKLSSSQPLYSDMVNTTPTSPTFQRASTLTVTQRLRRVFEYRKSNVSGGSSGSDGPSSIPPVPALPSVSPTVPAAVAASFPPQKPPSPQPILTHQIAQRSRRKLEKLEPVRPSNRPPPLLLSQDDDAFRGRTNTERDIKRRSRSVSLGRGTRSAREPTMEGLEALDISPMPRSAKTRPLPIRPLPRPPATAPLSVDDASDAGTNFGLVRRGGLRDPSRSNNDQW